jgi:haloacetate dehalogenase
MPNGSGPHFDRADARLLPGFRRSFVDLDGPVRVLVGGTGPPVLMLHGDPQTHLCWHRIAPRLAQRYTVVLADLRGRGESHKPAPTADHAPYAKRSMAAEQVQVMAALGFRRFAVVGHDRGGRVARRMALDHPEAVDRLAVLDIVPALDLYEAMTAEFAHAYYYFLFLAQPAPVPETLLRGAPVAFVDELLFGLAHAGRDLYDPVALAVYRAAASTPAAIDAMCECFRAGWTLDREQDRRDRAAGRRIACPSLVMWGRYGVLGRHLDVPAIWRTWCAAPVFAEVPGGHFLPEEAPETVADHLAAFLGD